MRIGNLTHTWVGDLKLELTSPGGTTVVLANRRVAPPTAATTSRARCSTTRRAPRSARGYGRPVHRILQAAGRPALALRRREPAGHLDAEGLGPGTGGHGDAQRLGSRPSRWGLRLRPAGRPGASRPASSPRRAPTRSRSTGTTPRAPPTTRSTVAARVGAIRRTPPRRQRASAFTDSGRTPGQEYCYKVGALNDASPGPLSEERCATVPLPAGPPGRRAAHPARCRVRSTIDLSGAAALDPGQPAGHLRAQLPRHARPGRLAQDHDRQGRGGRAQAEDWSSPGSRSRFPPAGGRD